MVLTARAENHIRGVDDLDDTITRLIAYRDAGADARLRAGPHRPASRSEPSSPRSEIPLNVLILPGGPTVAELARVGVRRVSTGSLLAARAYGALVEAATALRDDGDCTSLERPRLARRAQLRVSTRERPASG